VWKINPGHQPELATRKQLRWPWPLDHLQAASSFLAVTAAFDSEGEFLSLHSLIQVQYR